MVCSSDGIGYRDDKSDENDKNTGIQNYTGQIPALEIY